MTNLRDEGKFVQFQPLDFRATFLNKIKVKLPTDLELHKWEGDWGDYWEIRHKGHFWNIFRPSVSIDPISREFHVYHEKDVPLARRLAEIFPNLLFKTNIRRLLEADKK